MKTTRLIARCYAERIDSQWQAFCLDYCLAAQADSFEEAKQKLEQMLCEYIYDALEGEDREFAVQLLDRPAPFKYWVKYHAYRLMFKVGAFRNEVHRLFNEPLPLVPSSRCHNAH